MQASVLGGTTPAGEVRRRPRNRKGQIALAAAELFCERGYHGVGIDDIAAAIGVSGPALYRHFPNKYAILVHATRELGQSIVDATSGASDLDSLLAALARFAVERRRVAALYQWENRYLTPEHRAEFGAHLATLVDRFARPLRRARPDLTKAEADLLVRAAFSALGSLATHRATLPRGRAEVVLQRVGWALLRAPVPPPRPPRTAKAPREDPAPAGVGVGSRREILLTEAIRLFHHLGYHAVGVEDIGRAAGINASSVYRHFPSKADLLAAAYYRASERLAVATASALSGAVDGADALRRLTAAYVDFSLEHPDLVSVYLAENNNLPEPDRHELRKVQRLQVEEWVRLLVADRPDLPAPEARILVHAGLNVVGDLGRYARFDTGFAPEITRLAIEALYA